MKAGYTPKNLRDFTARFERDNMRDMKPEQWGAWVDALPIPELMAMCCMKSDAPEDAAVGGELLTVGEFTTRVMRQSRDELSTLRTQLSAAIGERDRLRKAVETARDTFTRYGDLHADKRPATEETKEKADINHMLAQRMADALSTSRKDGAS